MPTYEYQCEKCKKTFELIQSMKDSAIETCPKDRCRQKTWGKGKVRRLVGTGAGLIFKGTGFYITDYRSEGYKQSAKNEASGGGGGETKSGEGGKSSEGKPSESKASETKPAEKKPAEKPAAEKPRSSGKKE